MRTRIKIEVILEEEQHRGTGESTLEDATEAGDPWRLAYHYDQARKAAAEALERARATADEFTRLNDAIASRPWSQLEPAEIERWIQACYFEHCRRANAEPWPWATVADSWRSRAKAKQASARQAWRRANGQIA